MAAIDHSPSLRRNTAYNSLASLAALVVGFFLAPILLRHLGLEQFGFWSLIWAITGSLAVVDLRISAAVTRFAAVAGARGQEERIRHLASTGLAFYVGLGCLEIVIAAALLWDPAQTPLALPPSVGREGTTALLGAVGVFVVNSAGSVFVGLLQGLRRFDLTSGMAIAATGLRAVGVLSVVGLGGDLRALVLVEGAIAVLHGLAGFMLSRRVVDGLRLAPSQVRLGTLRELTAFGAKLQVAHLAHLISFHADKLLLSFFLGLPAVAFYELGSKVAYLMRGLPLLLISAVGPVASAMDAVGDRRRLWELYLKGSGYLVTAATPLLVFTLVGAGPILRVWLGQEIPEARQAIQILAVGYYANLVSGMAYTVAVAVGRPDLEMHRSVLGGTLNLLLSAALIPFVGFVGAPLGTALAFIVGSVYLVSRFHAVLGEPPGAVLRLLRGPLLLAVPTAAGAWLVHRWGESLDGGFWAAVLVLALSGLLIGVAHLALALRQRVVGAADLHAVGGWLTGR